MLATSHGKLNIITVVYFGTGSCDRISCRSGHKISEARFKESHLTVLAIHRSDGRVLYAIMTDGKQ